VCVCVLEGEGEGEVGVLYKTKRLICWGAKEGEKQNSEGIIQGKGGTEFEGS